MTVRMCCRLCGDHLDVADIDTHLHRMHPDVDGHPERWPDGHIIVTDHTPRNAMADEQYHKLHPDEFDAAFMLAASAYVGWLIAKDGVEPTWTEARNAAFRHAAQEAFNAGYRTGYQSAADGDLHEVRGPR